MSNYDNGHASKRQRTDTDGHGVQAGSVDRFDDPHKPSPSCVIHMRNLSEFVIDEDIWDACERYGKVADVMLMAKKRQALVEFEDLEGSRKCVQASSVYVAGNPAYVNYSTSQHIQRKTGVVDRAGNTMRSGRENMDEQQANHILLFTILEPIHPITVDVMNTICSNYGKVLRIVIFRKTGVQSMVEFEDIESAKAAKAGLQGADIYTNCCTLRIEYAKAKRVNVRRNDPMESWDYTIKDEPMERPQQRNRPLLPDPHYDDAQRGGIYDNNMRGDGGMQSRYPVSGNSAYGGGRDSMPMRDHGRDRDHAMPMDQGRGDRGMDRNFSSRYQPMDYQSADNYRSDPYGSGGRDGYRQQSSMYMEDNYRDRGHRDQGRGAPMDRMRDSRAPMLQEPSYGAMDRGMGGGDRPGCVLMVYGLNMEKMNCQRLFNLLCLYGNVIRIKYLMKKEGAAMVEMDDVHAVERAIQNLNKVTFFGSEMSVGKSKQTSIQEVTNPHKLNDNTSSYEDFSRSRNNRYTNVKHAEKNRVQMPSKVLHYFNAPPEMNDDDIKELFEGLGVQPPIKTKKLPSKSERSSLGLMLWDNLSDATEALVVANHHEVKNPNGRMPFIYKLCFSSNQNVD